MIFIHKSHIKSPLCSYEKFSENSSMHILFKNFPLIPATANAFDCKSSWEFYITENIVNAGKL